eukprot:TRINITY_DN1274_c0_g1_i1.p1 TRINITY_DN1274_c0_g1~~TRINITY_DN1274_c0_g1_i1.p1  ORF type:complete len:529 (+),score=102.71 TRINITY_DN1274_c0_g1_i1:223-1809(+)
MMRCKLAVVLVSVVLVANAQMGAPGAPSDISATDPAMLRALDAAVVQINQQSNSIVWSHAVSVISATRQVVQGNKYTIRIEMRDSTCRKNSMIVIPSLETCPPANGNTHVYEIVVQDRAWMTPQYSLLSHAVLYDQQVLGAHHVVSTNNPDMIEALNQGMVLLNQDSGLDVWQRPVRVLRAFEQTVAGKKWTIHVDTGMTNCARGSSGLTVEDCPIYGEISHVALVILHQQWATPRYSLLSQETIEVNDTPVVGTPSPGPVLDDDIDDNDDDSDDSDDDFAPPIADGPVSVPVTDRSVLLALEAAMIQLNAHSGRKMLFREVRVIEASWVMADTMLWTIRVELGATNCANNGQPRMPEDCPVVGETISAHLKISEQSYNPASPYTLLNSPLKVLKVSCPMFRCMDTGCSTYATDRDGCQDGCKCAEKPEEEPRGSDESDSRAMTALLWLGCIAFGIASLALILVPAYGWYNQRYQRLQVAELVATEEPPITGEAIPMPASPTTTKTTKMEEGASLVCNKEDSVARSQL